MKPVARHALVPVLAALVAGCATAASERSSAARMRTQMEPAAAQADSGFQHERALIRTARLGVEVRDVAAARASVGQIVAALAGSIESESSEQDGPTWLELRVPSASLERAVAQLAALGTPTHQSVSSADVTEQLADAEAQLANLRALRDRLRTLLERADKVSDLLEIERELTRTQTEIDRLDGTLTRMRSQVAMSQLSLTLERRPIPGPLGLIYLGLREAIGRLFWIRP